MTKKVYTIDVEDKNLINTKAKKSTKASKIEKSKTEKEIENFGIVEINNNSATKRLKNKTTEKGYSKTVVGSSKKAVKAETSKVDDYFDFDLRKGSAKTEKTAVSKTKKAKTAETKAKTKVKEAKVEAKAEETKVETQVSNNSTNVLVADAGDLVKFDSEANAVIRIAQMGIMFDYEKGMLNA